MYRPANMAGSFPLRAKFDPKVLGGSYVVDRLASCKIIKGGSIDLSAFYEDPIMGQELYAMGLTLREGEDYSLELYNANNIASAMFRIIDEDQLVSNYGFAHGWARHTIPLLMKGNSDHWNPMKKMYSGSLDLSGAHMPFANLNGFDLRDVDLRGADLPDADLSDADLSNSVFRDANLSGSTLIFTVMPGANMHSANLTRAAIRMADFSSADLTKAVFAKAVVMHSRFDDAVCLRADFREAFMRHNTYFRALFSGARLAGAEYDRAELLGEAYYDRSIDI